MFDLTRHDERWSFVCGFADKTARPIMGLLACAIIVLAAAAIPVVAHPDAKRTVAVAAETDVPGIVVGLRMAHRDVGGVAYASTRSPGRKSLRTSSREMAARTGAQVSRLGGARARSFSVALISEVLRRDRRSRRTTPSRRPLAIVLAHLDADGVEGDDAADAAVSMHGETAALPGSRPADVQTVFHRIQSGSVDFDSGLGRVTTAARAGTLNGQPAAALNIGLANGPIHFDAAGMAEMAGLADPATMRRAFKVLTVASIPLE